MVHGACRCYPGYGASDWVDRNARHLAIDAYELVHGQERAEFYIEDQC